MRGKALRRFCSWLPAGITPAYAGKRERHRPGAWPNEDHPRVCGEKLKIPCWIAPSVGSPPRMRGKVLASRWASVCCWITPAYAGKRLYASCGHGKGRDHPRVCGEKGSFSKSFTAFTGSPPRMRGKVAEYKLCGSLAGITPAYAGKSDDGLVYLFPEQDHPRVCGEKARTLIVQNEPQGSPPRMRGKEILPSRSFPDFGITPAYAGKSVGGFNMARSS